MGGQVDTDRGRVLVAGIVRMSLTFNPKPTKRLFTFQSLVLQRLTIPQSQ